MGIYVFSRKTLFDLLDTNTDHKDFGKEVIPASLRAVTSSRAMSSMTTGKTSERLALSMKPILL